MERLQERGHILVTSMVEPYESGRGRIAERTVYHVNERDSYVVVAKQ
ncbi:MAG: hypothetical protein WBB19_13085 [Desulforhopalus sp.]